MTQTFFIGTCYFDIKAMLKNIPEIYFEVFSRLYEENRFSSKSRTWELTLTKFTILGIFLRLGLNPTSQDVFSSRGEPRDFSPNLHSCRTRSCIFHLRAFFFGVASSSPISLSWNHTTHNCRRCLYGQPSCDILVTSMFSTWSNKTRSHIQLRHGVCLCVLSIDD